MISIYGLKLPRPERHLWDGLLPASAVALPMLPGLWLDGRIF